MKIKDSDKLKQMAYKFAQMANYFDRANSPHSRNFLEKDDERKLAEFYSYALQVWSQLKQETAAININNSKGLSYYKQFDNAIIALLKDGIDRLNFLGPFDSKYKILSAKMAATLDDYRHKLEKIYEKTHDSLKTYSINGVEVKAKSVNDAIKKVKNFNK